MDKTNNTKSKTMTYGDDYKMIPMTSLASGEGIEVLPDLYNYTIQIVNIQLVGDPGSDPFVLIDAGMPGSADAIIGAIDDRFGANAKPQAIILTHGHFDHVGAIIELIEHYKIPVYAHELELPYLTGEQSYPDPDPTVEGGLLSMISPLYPNEPIDLGGRVKPLPSDGTVPHLPAFRWIHTPGHTPGHVSLFRDRDRALIAGDAFTTVKQESIYSVFTQHKEISGPPRYLTPDWPAAKASVMELEKLKPSVAVTGHGMPMTGEELADNLQLLAKDFDRIAVPDHGKFVH
jgi:glyoxylase-like metal-dependent hydrolase (beta-lactamase superfamily II)